jgi:uncharacterized membrane protein
MKAYLLTSGAIFGLITVVHIWRLALEPNMLTQPWFLLITLCAAAFSVWALLLFRETARASGP